MEEISAISHTAPRRFESQLQQRVYAGLSKLGVSFSRLECDPAITMEQCEAVSEKLGAHVVKTLFLCNRQKTKFYLLIMSGAKPFVTRDFSTALGISRVSFAPVELLAQMLSTPVGAASPLSVFADAENLVQVVVDKDVMDDDCIACPDGTTTNYLKVSLCDILDKVFPHTGHKYTVIKL
ncbi:MAG: prolyl-tRNA synthetase associated domain-containing protein [Firmicutes bacterium]|nr:prolyl-tRNA synthetase associated domain-containing protein [Bacillota bacterium]MCM1401113.1 prolyl-tRNA synthetase associated domain-containing protein [Bacteroides sp.]MCM1477064.1 prolyl-tRNA synthetase associated domain-containing protein [Bacteroides sp.]